MNKKTKVVIIVLLILAVTLVLGSFFFSYCKEKEIKKRKEEDKKIVNEIKHHYNNYVKTTKDTYIYIKEESKYKKIGSITKDEQLVLKNQKITKNTKYFQIDKLDFYIKYNDVEKIDTINQKDERYKHYIPFNENVITKEKVKLYKDDKLIFELYKSLDLPIIIKDDNGYYVEYYDELYLIKNEDVEKTYEKENTKEEVATEIATTVYHFIYKEGDTSCNEMICHSENQVRSHFDYLKNNNYFTLTTKELELFIDSKIRLPKNSVLLTIDDGARAQNFIPILEEYKINATLFLITSWYDKKDYLSNYLEVASHSNDLHNPGKCPGGQGGPIKCLDRTTLLNDLKTSREKLDQTEAFCFPFYEYNDYALSIVKEAGFKIAFIGGMKKVRPGIDKFKTPRISLNNKTTQEEFANYIK